MCSLRAVASVQLRAQSKAHRDDRAEEATNRPRASAQRPPQCRRDMTTVMSGRRGNERQGKVQHCLCEIFEITPGDGAALPHSPKISAAPAVGWKYAPPSAIHHRSRRVLQYPISLDAQCESVRLRAFRTLSASRADRLQLSSALAQLSSAQAVMLYCAAAGVCGLPMYSGWRCSSVCRACTGRSSLLVPAQQRRRQLAIVRARVCSRACMSVAMRACVPACTRAFGN